MVIENKTAANVTSLMRNKLKDSGILPADVTKLKLTVISRKQTRELNIPEACGFKIPYFDMNGKQLSYFRIRYLEKPVQKGFNAQLNRKAIKYVQLANSNAHVYFTPNFFDWRVVAKKTDIPIVITEGELKAICACKMKIPTLGLGGVWSFKSKKQKTNFLPELKKIEWSKRVVYIVYDADAVHNPKVLQAENALAEELLANGAEVYIVRLPNLKEVEKTGLDDFLMHRGKDAFGELLEKEAYEFKSSQALHLCNTEVSYVRDPGLIIQLQTGLRISPSNFTSIAYSNRLHDQATIDKDGNEIIKKVPTANVWKRWPYRSELERMTYVPGENTIIESTAEYNTWSGWGVESVKGDVKPWKELLKHIFGSDKESMEWFEKWAAYPIQHPGTKLLTAVVIWGLIEGSGKTLIGHTLMRVYGENAGEIHDVELRNPDNDWAENKQFILADDITGHNNRELANRLKTLITQKSVRINIKYIPSYSIPDCINYYFTSNDVDAFFLTKEDRRYFIHEVLNDKPDQEWLKKFLAWRDKDKKGMEALRYHFETLDLTGFDPAAPAPKTISKEQMVNITRSDLSEWIHNLGQRGDLIINGIVQNGDLWTSNELLRQYDPEGRTNVKANGMARELSKAGFRQLKQIRTDVGMIRLFPLRNCKKWEVAKPNQIANHYLETCPEAARINAEAKAKKSSQRYKK